LKQRVVPEESPNEEPGRLLADLQSVMQNMPVGCLMNNLRGEITYWNAAAEKIFGFSAAEVLGRNMDARMIPPHTRAQVDRVRQSLAEGTQVLHSVNQNLTKEGRLITCEWENAPLFNAAGEFSGFLALVRDVTDQQRLSNERDQLLERLQLVMDSAPVAMIISDNDLRVSYWNPAAERIFGFSPQEAMGRIEYDFFVPPENRDLVWRNIHRMVAEGKEVRAVNENVTKDGRRILCEWINTPLVGPDGKVRGLISIAQDVTERRRTALALEDSERRFRGIVEDTPIPVWMEDFSLVKQELQRLQREGVRDIRAYLAQNPDQVMALMGMVRLLEINQAAVEMHHAPGKAELIAQFVNVFTAGSTAALVETMAFIAEGRRMFDLETELRTLDGQTLWVIFRWQAARGHEETADRVLISVVDTSQGKKREADQVRNLGKLQLLTLAAVEINSAPDLDRLLEKVVDWSRQVTGANLAAISLSEDGGETQRVRAVNIRENIQSKWIAGLKGRVIRRDFFATLFANGHSMRFSERVLAQIELEDPLDAYIFRNTQFHGYLAVPIISQAGSHLGILHLGDSQSDPFDASDEALATQLGLIAAAALEKQTLMDQLRQAEERMRELARQVVGAQEKERQLIARELHDETGQNMTALKLSLQMAAEDLPVGYAGLQNQLRESIDLAETVMNQTRELARMLRPPRLEAISLGASLEGLCIDYSKRMRIPVSYQGCDLPEMTDLMALSIYRFVQEGLTNVARHSQAHSARVSLACEEHAVEVSIEDDGHGFDTVELNGQSGIGLRGLQERIEMLNGTLRIVTHRGQGSRLIAHIPLEGLG